MERAPSGMVHAFTNDSPDSQMFRDITMLCNLGHVAKGIVSDSGRNRASRF